MCFCHLKDFEVVELVFLSFAPRDDLAKGGEDERLEPSNWELEGGWGEENYIYSKRIVIKKANTNGEIKCNYMCKICRRLIILIPMNIDNV